VSNVLVSNLKIAGANFDRVRVDFNDFLVNQMWPDRSTTLLESWERAYQLPSTGSTAERQGRILAAVRNTGGLSKQYIEDLANDFGAGAYTVVITEGTGTDGFIVDFDPIPTGIGSPLPATIGDPTLPNQRWNFTATITGAPFSPQPELEALILKIKPAWTRAHFVYV
jgi:uncharacterized protein YmfQ (DUF2313 family)